MGRLSTLEVDQLAIGYGARRVAGGIDLSVGAGDVLCLLGPNGSGKTTLFRTLLGLIPPLGGEVRVDGQPLRSLGRRDIARHIAFVPQATVSDFAYPVADLVLMGRTAHLGPFDSPTARDRAKAALAMARLGIEHLADADSTRISGGQRQLALIARALAQDAGLIVMDEPTASLDLGNRGRVLDVIAGLASEGLAVVLSTHEPDHAFAVATKAAVLCNGELAALGPPRDVLTPKLLSLAYATPLVVETTASGRLVVAAATH